MTSIDSPELLELIKKLEGARAKGEPTGLIDREIAEYKAKHGQRRITGEAHIALPVPGSSGG